MSKRLVSSLLACVLLIAACQQENKDTKAAQSAETKEQTDAQLTKEQAADTAKLDLSAEEAAYRAWLKSEMDQLVVGVEEFAAALKAGDVEKAKQLYPRVRANFERSEPIASSFGDFDPRIDNREAALEPNEEWTGFHPIEKILWTQNTTEGTQKLADQLLADVKELRKQVDTMPITAELMIQGAVDLLNEVSTGKITGEENIFSKTDLYDFQSNIEGAEQVFKILQDKIKQKDANLVETVKQRFDAVYQELNKHKQGEEYKRYDELSADDTKGLAEVVNKLGEHLAQTGIVLE